MTEKRFIVACILCGQFLFSFVAHSNDGVKAVDTAFAYTFSMQQRDGNTEKSIGVSDESMHYSISPCDYRGIASWRIHWRLPLLEADYYIRRSDNVPLYSKRMNRALGHDVEIEYSLSADKPHLYRRSSDSKVIERKIWNQDLFDLGALPMLLATAVMGEQSNAERIYFRSINYSNGKVYSIVARRTGFKLVSLQGEQVRCGVYSVNADSWLANFNHPATLFIPTTPGYGPFAAYDGPSPLGNGETVSIREMTAKAALL